MTEGELKLPNNYKDIFELLYNAEILDGMKRIFLKEQEILDIQYDLILTIYYDNKPLVEKDYSKFVSFWGDNSRIELMAYDIEGNEFSKKELIERFKNHLIEYLNYSNLYSFQMEK